MAPLRKDFDILAAEATESSKHNYELFHGSIAYLESRDKYTYSMYCSDANGFLYGKMDSLRGQIIPIAKQIKAKEDQIIAMTTPLQLNETK